MAKYNSQYISASEDWKSLTPREQREILRGLGYDQPDSTKWNELPKSIREQLERIYPDTLQPDETMELKPGQNYHCNPDEEWVPSYRKKDGTHVHGFCRKRRNR